jgi:hypothetical protein
MAAKIQIPEELKADLPQTKWGKILSATPIIMTVIATALAGLASSEMTRAQYARSLAAQQQSKAGDQWGYFQAKKLRAAMQHSTLDLLQGLGQMQPTSPGKFAGQPPAIQAALENGRVPDAPALALDPKIKAALDAVESTRSEAEAATLLATITPEQLQASLVAAKDRALSFDAMVSPISSAIDKLEKDQPSPQFIAARLRYHAARYEAESRLNQAIANIYELLVRKSNLLAERHHKRSGRFFFGMLAAQLAVIIATFAIAARKRNFLWSVAAVAGTGAVAFSAYVFLYL